RGAHGYVVAVGGSFEREPLGRTVGGVLDLGAPCDDVEWCRQTALHGDGGAGAVLADRDLFATDGSPAQEDRVARRFWCRARLLSNSLYGQDKAQRTSKIEGKAHL